MSVGLDAEGLLAIYADWLAFLREKRGMFEAQLAKLQGKPEKQGVDAVVAKPLGQPQVENPPETHAAPAWLFQAAPAPGEAEEKVAESVSEEDELDEWM